eukprot:3322438-Amphidinium_carterae.1
MSKTDKANIFSRETPLSKRALACLNTQSVSSSNTVATDMITHGRCNQRRRALELRASVHVSSSSELRRLRR